ncbi:DUF167 family protein [Methylotuvimicrobium sp. KM1]|uniref:DUF167 family protein n=1 Tax=Methylotuvimicrobium sp. KM1 TaxID=3377707 RepID=UPI00384FA786
MSWFCWQHDQLILSLHIQPKSSRDEWSGLHGERLKLRIKAPPVDGKANAYLIRFLAKEFGVNKSACKLLSGETGRDKRISITAPKKFPALSKSLELIGKPSERDAKNR